MINYFLYLHLITLVMRGILFNINNFLDNTHWKFVKEMIKDVGIVWIILIICPIANLFLLFFEIFEFIDNVKYQLQK